jgi:hypothetical protein
MLAAPATSLKAEYWLLRILISFVGDAMNLLFFPLVRIYIDYLKKKDEDYI